MSLQSFYINELTDLLVHVHVCPSVPSLFIRNPSPPLTHTTLLHTYVILHTFCSFDTYFSHVNINVRLTYCKSVSFHGTLLVTTDWTTFCDSSSVTRSPQSRSKSRSRSQSQSRSQSWSQSLSQSQSRSQSQSQCSCTASLS